MTVRHLALALCLIATGALAHDNVQNPSVQARMQMMKDIKAATGVLGNMAKQPASYSQADAEAAAAKLADLAGRIPAAFEDAATDPQSESSPAIWDNWNDFTAKAAALQSAAQDMDAGSAEGVAAGMLAIGGACGACHQPYRL
ncbi:c-type cytochrome [Pseudooceanicola onchidii]|uniref:c-type cytochrome n=1 Tax=Pseudooceanicola onchidii TaxID=2562279 RepID=UPI00145A9A62|nr:cytochrome c [Pseudooceanicola onchidii]